MDMHKYFDFNFVPKAGASLAVLDEGEKNHIANAEYTREASLCFNDDTIAACNFELPLHFLCHPST